MQVALHLASALALMGGIAGCAAPGGAGAAARAVDGPGYLGVETRLLDDDLVNFFVRMDGGASTADLAAYARCAAAQYTLIRGYGFARHVRTNVTQEGGVWTADAVYTISSALPNGVSQIDAEVVVDDCANKGIPTV